MPMSSQPELSRRQLGKVLSAGTFFYFIPQSLWASSPSSLPIPPLLTNKRGRPIFLSAESTTHQLDEKTITVWGFNGHYLGATLQLQRGEFAKFHWINHLKQPIAINIQGLEAEGELYGGISRTLFSKQSWSPVIPINQMPATCLYRACTWQKSAYQTYRGLAGLCIIDDPSTYNNLPHQYGVNDIPLILQDMQLNNDGEQLFQPYQSSFLGNRLFVNGQENPYLNVGSEIIRLRIANASVSRSYHLHFEDNRPFQLIALDHGFLAKAISLRSIRLAPSERIEILVDLSNGENVRLLAGEKLNLFDRVSHFFQSNILISNVVLTLRTSGFASAFNQSKTLQFDNDIHHAFATHITQVRQFHINTDNATLNGQHFNLRRIDIIAKHQSIERWQIQTNKPISFHIQGAKFLIEENNHQRPLSSLIGWKDSVYIENSATLRVKFTHRSSRAFPFIFGSADLALADAGCLGTLVVT